MAFLTTPARCARHPSCTRRGWPTIRNTSPRGNHILSQFVLDQRFIVIGKDPWSNLLFERMSRDCLVISGDFLSLVSIVDLLLISHASTHSMGHRENSATKG